MRCPTVAVISVTLLAIAHAPTAGAAGNELRLIGLGHQAQALELEAMGIVAKEITPNCVAVPLPTTPFGPTWSFEVDTAASQRLRITAWRQPCSDDDAQLVVTFQPLQGTPFVCGSEMEIFVGGERTDNIFLDANPNDGVASNFCGSLAAETSFVMRVVDGDVAFDDDAAFTLGFESDFGPDGLVQIPAYDPAQYGDFDRPLSGRLSGAWFDPARAGEGVLLDFSRAGEQPVVFVAWFTYSQGSQLWLAGNANYTPGDTEAVIPLIQTTGGEFGDAFDPDQVQSSPWGEVTLRFPDCNSLEFAWSEDGGSSGALQYRRLIGPLDGVSCP